VAQIDAEIVLGVVGAFVLLVRVVDKLIDGRAAKKAGPICSLSPAALAKLEKLEPCHCWFEKGDRDQLHDKDTIAEVKKNGESIAAMRLDMASRRCPHLNKSTENQ
jgi:hypothetical protein